MRWVSKAGRILARGLIAAVLCLALAPGVAGAATEAKEPRAVLRKGTCSGPTHWKLNLRFRKTGGLVVVFTAWGGASGQTWNVFIEDKGKLVFSGSRTSGDDGYFRVRNVSKNRPGVDRVVVTANNVSTGETCTARASI